jgi:transcriptional regulator of aromatic amino acid metabolism
MDRDYTSSKNNMENQKAFLNALDHPTLLMQAEPRQVVTANKKACELFGKGIGQIEGHRGGQVFDCVHAFTEAGCGLDANCENCKIKNAVVDTFSTGNSHDSVHTILDIQKHKKTTAHEIQVSTEKIGDFVLITIEKYIEKS